MSRLGLVALVFLFLWGCQVQPLEGAEALDAVAKRLGSRPDGATRAAGTRDATHRDWDDLEVTFSTPKSDARAWRDGLPCDEPFDTTFDALAPRMLWGEPPVGRLWSQRVCTGCGARGWWVAVTTDPGPQVVWVVHKRGPY